MLRFPRPSRQVRAPASPGPLRRLLLCAPLLFAPACAPADNLPPSLASACVEPASDLGLLLERRRDTLRAHHRVHLTTADLAAAVARRVGTRTDLRCVPVIDSVVAEFADLTTVPLPPR